MKYISILLLALASIFSISCGSSQNTTTSHDSTEVIKKISLEQMGERQTTQMTERLNLTPDQSIAVNAINIEYAKKLEDIRQQPRSRSKMNAFISMNKSKSADMKKILSSDQYKVYEEMMDEMKAEMKNKRRGRQDR